MVWGFSCMFEIYLTDLRSVKHQINEMRAKSAQSDLESVTERPDADQITSKLWCIGKVETNPTKKLNFKGRGDCFSIGLGRRSPKMLSTLESDE